MTDAQDGRTELPGHRRTVSGLGRRLELARALVGYDADDEWRVKLTFELVSDRADDLARDVYEHMGQLPETAVFFLTADGERDRAHIAERIESLKRWLASLDGPLNQEAALRVIDIGRAHTARAGDEGIRIRARYLLLTMGLIQSAVAGVLASQLVDPAELGATVAAWGKLLIIHLDLLLTGYAGASASAHWY